MAKLTKEAVRAALTGVIDPASGRDVVSAGLARGLTVRGAHVGFIIESEDGRTPQDLEPLRAAAEHAVRALAGVDAVTAVLTAHNDAAPSSPAPRPRHALRSTPAAASPPPKGVRLAPAAAQQGAVPQGGAARGLTLPGVTRMVAVASGKGGVGKYTVAANLACALARQGLRVGLLDADVYGPSAPILMGLREAEPQTGRDKKLIAPEAYGVKVMSMGFLVAPDAPMIWRGPIIMSALTQLLNDVAWGTEGEPLDVLVADLPPGTGDAQLTLIQRAPLNGAVIVSTPQELALADVRRGVAMFERTHVPILGVVENMSAHVDPETGKRFAPFGAGGAKRAAEALGAPFLGALPLDGDLARLSDAGTPPAATAPDSALGRAFADLAQAVHAGLEAEPGRPAPLIQFED